MKKIILKKNFLKLYLNFVALTLLIIFTKTSAEINISPKNTCNITKQSTNTKKYPEIKDKLKGFFNFLEKKEVIVLRMILANERAEKTLEYLKKYKELLAKNQTSQQKEQNKKIPSEAEVIKKCKIILLTPVNQFFEPMHKFSSLIRPVIEIVFNIDPKNKTTYSDLLSIQFFDTAAADIPTFFDKKLTNIDLIIKTCEEFQALFGPITENLSPAVLKKADDLYKEAQKETQAKNDKTQQHNSHVA